MAIPSAMRRSAGHKIVVVSSSNSGVFQFNEFIAKEQHSIDDVDEFIA